MRKWWDGSYAPAFTVVYYWRWWRLLIRWHAKHLPTLLVLFALVGGGDVLRARGLLRALRALELWPWHCDEGAKARPLPASRDAARMSALARGVLR